LFGLLARMGPWVMLAAFLFVAGIVLTLIGKLFGFDLADVDVWLAAHSWIFTGIGSIILRLICGTVLLACVFVLLSPFYVLLARWIGPRMEPPPRSLRQDLSKAAHDVRWGCWMLAIPGAWFAFVGTFLSYA
jgi:hypothetical protein